MWCRLDDLAFYKKGPFGSSLTKSMFIPDNGKAYKVYEQKNAIQKNASLGHYFISGEKFQELKGFEVLPNDIIVSCAGTIGETYIMPSDIRSGIINQALMIIRLYDIDITPFYLLYFDYILKNKAGKDGKGTAIKNIPPFDILKNYMIPLPPLREQIRIINEVTFWQNFIDSIDSNCDNISALCKRTKSKVLDLAISGKLLPQDNNDEPAINHLKKINPDYKPCDNRHYENIPFELPETWLWVTLSDISNYGECANVSVDKISNESWVLELEDIEKDSGRLLQRMRKSDRTINGVRHSFQKGDVLYSKLRTYLNKVLVADQDGYCTTEIIPITCGQGIVPEYLCHVLRSKYYVDYTISLGYGVKMPRLGTGDALKSMIPVPPYEEQRRIVKSVNEIYHKLEQISSEL